MYLHGKEQFTSLKELTIHILGAAESFEYEGGSPTCIWEEIMHCLPAVKTLKVIFIGPEGKLNMKLFSIEACPDCISKGRVRMQGFHDTTYHDYRASDEFLKPDFAAAFNTGLYDEFTESWKESVAVLLDLEVPCIFTSFNKDEGEADLKVLCDVGAKTLTETTNLNPFHVKIPFIDDNYIDKFFYHNMYYICFKGRVGR
jgi:splicing suppressor protein 51